MDGKTIILAVCRNLAQQSWSDIEIEPRFGPHWISQRLYIVHLWSNSCLVQTEDSCIWVNPDYRDLGKHVVHTTVCCPRVNSFTVKKNTHIIKMLKKIEKTPVLKCAHTCLCIDRCATRRVKYAHTSRLYGCLKEHSWRRATYYTKRLSSKLFFKCQQILLVSCDFLSFSGYPTCSAFPTMLL